MTAGGNMYKWVGFTWNPLAGECPHDCEYCYVKSLAKRYPQLREKYRGDIRIDEKALNQRLPRNRIIFVCSMNDLFADAVPDEYIERILEKTREWQGDGRRFLFQTKNPRRMINFIDKIPDASILATTIETNKEIIRTNAPPPSQRIKDFIDFKEAMMEFNLSHLYEITIEPILDFDLHVLVAWVEGAEPDFISIGADSKGHHLPEPDEEKVVELVRRLERVTDVLLKKNLKRIAPSLFVSQVEQEVEE